MDADFVDGDDVGMLEAGGRDGFGAKALDELRAGLRPEQQHLERDNPVQALLPGLIDDPHPAPRDLLQQLVVAEVISNFRFPIADCRARRLASRSLLTSAFWLLTSVF